GVPYAEGGRVFFTRGSGLADQDELVVADGPDAEPRVLLDPNELSSDGTVSLAGWSPSRDGRLLAYGLSDGGSDWTEWRVREVDTGCDRPDRVQRVKFSDATWLPDGSGFLYGRYDESGEADFQARNENQRLFLHRLGTLQEEDELVLERPDEPSWGFGPWISHDGRWLVVTVWRGAADEHAIWVRPLAAAGEPFRELLPDFDAAWQVAGSDGDRLLLLTDRDAPLGRVVGVDLAGGGPAVVETIVPEGEAVLEQARRVGDRLVVSELHDAKSRVRVFGLDGGLDHEVELPEAGSATGFWGQPGESTTWFSFSSFTRPPSIHRHDVASGRTEERRRPEAPFRPEDFETTQHFVQSTGGARVPVFLTRRRGLDADGRRPVLLYGYGGFQSPLTPSYSR
ncbi:MAG: prolyl oligopeptidase family protein, partial [Planctomycetota bacterium]